MLLQVAFALICLSLGGSAGYAAGLFKIGWWFADETDPIKARASLKNLEALTSRVSSQVAEHARRVEDVQRGLDAGEAGDAEPVAIAAEVLRNANEELQAELRKAKRDLEKQAGELQSHRREARTDGLTQLLNRRAFDEEMDRLPQRIATTGCEAALLMFDIDHFKKFNDTYGHQVGDRVIKHVADALRQTLMGLDVVAARYGGEEFAVILASGSLLMAARVADDIRVAVESTALKHEGKSLTVTVSIGFAQTPTGLEPEDTLALADAALYTAKRGGRNCGYYHHDDHCLPIAELLAVPAHAPAASDETQVAEDIAELEASLRSAKRAALGSPQDRRKHERRPYPRAHQIGPIVGGRMPTPEMFEEVRFFDISSGGFGLLLPSPPQFKSFIVTLEKIDGNVYALAEVVRLRRSEEVDETDRRLWEVGCRFTGKLQAAQMDSQTAQA